MRPMAVPGANVGWRPELSKRGGRYLVNPGKRGKYELTFCNFTGWDPARDAEIQVGDEIPDKAWIACNISVLSSPGRGRDTVKRTSFLTVLVPHHVLSRSA
jgi:hypothetical protein